MFLRNLKPEGNKSNFRRLVKYPENTNNGTKDGAKVKTGNQSPEATFKIGLYRISGVGIFASEKRPEYNTEDQSGIPPSDHISEKQINHVCFFQPRCFNLLKANSYSAMLLLNIDFIHSENKTKNNFKEEQGSDRMFCYSLCNFNVNRKWKK